MPITLYTWNVNGIRAAEKKGFVEWLNEAQPDILGVQETKAAPEQLSEDLLEPQGYTAHWAVSTAKKGYSGVALYTKAEPNDVEIGLGIDEYDVEGRTIIAHYDAFTLMTAYFPNGSSDHSRVPFKMAYKAAFLEQAEAFRDEGRPVIFCGDINTAHRPIDLARPKANEKKTGFLPEERVWIDEVLDKGYIDIHRHLNPDTEGEYSWWSYRGGARGKNVGWRLDMFFITPDLLDAVTDSTIHRDVMGSDHCPVSLTLNL
ncbi:MAG: exodeoxyribonuclease III [Chloroflexota bacterium]